jgi:hypothetical protein
VIGVLTALASVTISGANAWKNATDRTTCIINLRNIQQAVRCYQNVNGYNDGSQVKWHDGDRSIPRDLYRQGFISGRTYAQILGVRSCAGGGVYGVVNEERFPKPGELFVRCSLEGSEGHIPASTVDW